ncbi:MAG: hypothetical protein M3065_10175 [Actinomycetota bacterium]|nr:hypothetical protein [Actinomycetota bacterium]
MIAEAVRAKSVSAASQSFGVVALALLLVLLIEWEAVRVIRSGSRHWWLLTVATAPLALVASLTILARIAPLFH